MLSVSRIWCHAARLSPYLFASLSASVVSAWAQSASPDTAQVAAAPAVGQGLEEIDVTAQRRTTSLQATPLAISAVTGAALDKSNTNELAGLNGTVPSLEITKSSGFETVVTIRGVGSETPENAPTTTPGVSFFVDGVYVANTISLDQTLFDIDHIEVLRGPQGALFGQSSIGGAITVVTKQPQLGEFSGVGDVSFGDYDLHRERAEINIPVGDEVAVRASAQLYSHDGFTRNSLLGSDDLDDANDTSAKVAVLWRPVDTFSATLTGQLFSSDQNGNAQKNILDPNSDPRVLAQDYPSKFNLDTDLIHLNLQWDLPWLTLKSVSAYQYLDHRQQEDSSRSAFSLIGAYDDVAAWNTKLQNYNEEFDVLSPAGSTLEWIAGVFALSQKTSQFVAEFEGTTPNPDVDVVPGIEAAPPSNLAYGNLSTVDRKSYSAFLQATYHVTDDFRATLGGRFNYDSYHLDSLNFSEFQIADVKHNYSDHRPTFRGQLEYDITPENLVYASISRGYKPGGVNGIASAVVVPNTFKPETNTAFEIGSKNTFFDNSIRANFAAFYYIYKNQQYIETDPVPFDGGMANIPSTHIWGGEAEASYTGFDHRLRVNANLSVEQGEIQGSFKTIDSTVQQTIEATAPACAFGGAFYNPACWAAVIASARDVGGNSPAKMPTVSGSIDISYALPVFAGTLTPRIQYIYRDSFWARIFAEPTLDKVPSYSLVNLNFDYVPDKTNFKVSLAITNLGDVAGINSRYTDPYGTFTTSQQYIPPRQIIGTISYYF